MTADEIRKQFSTEAYQGIIGMNPSAAAFTLALSGLVIMGEIAAQLAELNDNDRKRIALLEESNAFQKEQKEQYRETQIALRRAVAMEDK